jgi:hypothetical protein
MYIIQPIFFNLVLIKMLSSVFWRCSSRFPPQSEWIVRDGVIYRCGYNIWHQRSGSEPRKSQKVSREMNEVSFHGGEDLLIIILEGLNPSILHVSKLSSAEIPIGLHDFFVRIHHEGPSVSEGLIVRLTLKE